jgi:hypothetical protein
MGMEVLGISCITNPAAGVLPTPLVHEAVMEVAKRVKGEFSRLLEGILERLWAGQVRLVARQGTAWRLRTRCGSAPARRHTVDRFRPPRGRTAIRP